VHLWSILGRREDLFFDTLQRERGGEEKLSSSCSKRERAGDEWAGPNHVLKDAVVQTSLDRSAPVKILIKADDGIRPCVRSLQVWEGRREGGMANEGGEGRIVKLTWFCLSKHCQCCSKTSAHVFFIWMMLRKRG
jgi:hypothetical protein